MNGEDIIPTDKGFFLPKSWRMPPTLTNIVSQMFYEGRLEPELTNSPAFFASKYFLANLLPNLNPAVPGTPI